VTVTGAEHVAALRVRANESLEERLPDPSIQPMRLHEAMRYAVLNGGKRVRAVLVYAAGEALEVGPEGLDAAASAVELIHAYSLVHDDMPAMDDDDLRRGKPTCHRAFDEATALLAGDALQTLAFHVLAHDRQLTAGPAERVAMVEALALASGSRGMAGGQAIDLAAVGHSLDVAQLENMHIHKTGALIRASVKLGALACPGLTPEQLSGLDHYAKCIGLAFQIQDDILDVEGDTSTLGKRQGADQALNKPTYPSLLGLAESKRRAVELHQDAVDSLATFGAGAETLRWIAGYIVSRSH
jgi:farnesyl diphosphate synthase